MSASRTELIVPLLISGSFVLLINVQIIPFKLPGFLLQGMVMTDGVFQLLLQRGGRCVPRLIIALILLLGVQLFLLELHDPFLRSLVLTRGSLKLFPKLAEAREGKAGRPAEGHVR